LKHNEYRIRGTVRKLKEKPEKLAPLRVGLGDRFSELEIVEADLMDE
jgi:hypothetical protein